MRRELRCAYTRTLSKEKEVTKRSQDGAVERVKEGKYCKTSKFEFKTNSE